MTSLLLHWEANEVFFLWNLLIYMEVGCLINISIMGRDSLEAKLGFLEKLHLMWFCARFKVGYKPSLAGGRALNVNEIRKKIKKSIWRCPVCRISMFNLSLFWTIYTVALQYGSGFSKVLKISLASWRNSDQRVVDSDFDN